MKPSLGRIVIAHVPAECNNGSTEAPAVITRVWSDTMVNLRVLCDSESILWWTSVTLHDDKPEDPKYSCWWPQRVGS